MNRSPEEVLDELLVLRAQGGDEEAFSALVARWHRSLVRHALHLTERSDAAADVSQETWLAIARGIAGLEDPACFARWALQIVSRKSADWVRSRQRERRLIERLADNHIKAFPPTKRSTDERNGQVLDAVGQLPSERRALLSMIFHDNLSISDAAEVLDIPVGTVKSRLHHTYRELKALLERNQP